MKNNTLAIVAAAPAIPANPNSAATSAMTKNIIDQPNITFPFVLLVRAILYFLFSLWAGHVPSGTNYWPAGWSDGSGKCVAGCKLPTFSCAHCGIGGSPFQSTFSALERVEGMKVARHAPG